MPWATTAKIKVHVIFTQQGFTDVEKVKQMLAVTNSAYKANNPTDMGVNFEFASSEKVFENALIADVPTREVEIQFHLARQARAVRYPGKLVVIFRYNNGAGHQSSTWADYIVMFEPDGYAFAHEVGHYLHLGHTFNEGNIGLLDEANKFFGFEGAKAAAIETIRISEDLGVFDADAGDPDAPEGGGFARVGDTPPDPGPPLFQTKYYVTDGTGTKSANADDDEHCKGPGTLSLEVGGKTYQLAPDRTNVMSYFFGCKNFVHTVSPHQRRVIKRVLAGGNRRHLVNGASPEGPASVVTPDGAIHVFARGDDRNIYRNVGKGTAWSGWQADMGAGTFVSGPAAVAAKDGIHVFACGDDRAVWHNFWNGKVWSGWGGSDLAGGTMTSAPAAVVTPDDFIHVFARGDDRNIWHNFGWGKTWNGWKGGELGEGGVLMSGPTAVVTKDGTIHVFACGVDRTVWHSFGKGQVWNGWKGGELGPGTLTSGPTAAVTPDGFIHILGRGDDRNIWHSFWNGKVWSAWKPHLSKDTFMSGVATVISGDKALHAFALNDARSIVHSSLIGQTWSGWDSKLAGGTFQP
jgi:hypothetical protein